MKRCDESVAVYHKAIELNADYGNAFYNRAKLWEQKKDYDKAIADYQKCFPGHQLENLIDTLHICIILLQRGKTA
jgi:tetratricopeptide (TPR) repeat protein